MGLNGRLVSIARPGHRVLHVPREAGGAAPAPPEARGAPEVHLPAGLEGLEAGGSAKRAKRAQWLHLGEEAKPLHRTGVEQIF